MARHKSDGSYGHRIKAYGVGNYRLSWVVDRYYENSRLRFPRSCHRDTDENGARKFAEKWGLIFPLPTA